MIGWTIKNEEAKNQFIARVEELFEKHGHIEIQYSTEKPRTIAQNNALHLWLGQVAGLLNEKGLDMKKVLKPEVDIPWTLQSAKDHLWRPIQRLMTGEESTKDAKRAEYIEIHETICRHLAQTKGVELPKWTSRND